MAETLRSFRLVCPLEQVPLVEALLMAEGYAFEPEPFAPAPCRRLTAEPNPLGASLAATFGLVYIQDRSSMLPPLALNPPPGAAVLDMCASPGSKTGLAAQLVGPHGLVLANEPTPSRLATLRQNLRRMNLLHTASCCFPGQELPLTPGSWTHIVLDPPCSGWGTADKNPKVMELWREGKTAPLIGLQRALIAHAATLLTPGGHVLYSTCTTNTAENEEQVVWAAQELELEVAPLAPLPGFGFETPHLGLTGVLRVDAEASAAQGFFLALLRKPGQPDEPRPSTPSRLPGRELDPTSLDPNGDLPLDFSLLPPGKIYDFGGKAFFLPQKTLTLPPELRWQGFALGKLAKGRLLPWPGLRALSPAPGACATLVLDDPDAVRALLAGRAVEHAGNEPWVGLSFAAPGGALPLGLLKRKGKRLLWAAG